MERGLIFVALLGVCCVGARPSLAQAAEQAPDTMEARVTAQRAKEPTTLIFLAWPESRLGISQTSFWRFTPAGGVTRP